MSDKARTRERKAGPTWRAARKPGHAKRLVLALSVAAGLLAVGAPAVTQAPQATATTRTAAEHVNLTAAHATTW